MPTFVVVPQWQGSGSSRAMRLVDGAEAIRGDLPSGSTRVVDVPLEAGDARGTGVPRFGSLSMVRDRMLETLSEIEDAAITIGGDCGVELAAVGHALSRADGDVAVVWFDAHPDLNTPDTSLTGVWGGMVLRTLAGDGPTEFVPTHPLDPSRIVLAGTRATDDAEDEYLAAQRIVPLGVEDLESTEALVAAVRATGAASVYIHIDLDVLDPGEFAGLSDPVPFGLSAAKLVENVKALKANFGFAGAGITAFAPASPEEAVEDLPTILRLIGALAA